MQRFPSSGSFLVVLCETMGIEYTEEKKFTKEQTQRLFRSVGWISGEYPERLHKALMGSSTVFSACHDDRLVGLVRVLDDTELEGVRHATEKVRKRDRYTQVSWAFCQLQQMIEYKAVKSGHPVIMVDPRYTSQTCPKCGMVRKTNRDKRLHEYRCSNCSYRSNDDRVAANEHSTARIPEHS